MLGLHVPVDRRGGDGVSVCGALEPHGVHVINRVRGVCPGVASDDALVALAVALDGTGYFDRIADDAEGLVRQATDALRRRAYSQLRERLDLILTGLTDAELIPFVIKELETLQKMRSVS